MSWAEEGNIMQICELAIATPYYVLMDQKTPFGPHAVDPTSNLEYSTIFGFSDKARYDTFCRASSVPLRPYPLVKGYLRSQLNAPGNANVNQRRVKLVVLDAPGPREPDVHAATIQAVLEAQEQGAAHLTPTHHLTFNAESNDYRLKDTPA